MAAIGSPEKVTAAIRELEANHVTNFISYLDAGGLDFDKSPALWACSPKR